MKVFVNRIAATAIVFNLAAGLALLHGGTASGQGNPQYPMLDKISENVIQKYKTTPCAQLAQREKNPPPKSPIEQRAVEMLGADPKLRAAFFQQVGGAILDKMFECGLIP